MSNVGTWCALGIMRRRNSSSSSRGRSEASASVMPSASNSIAAQQRKTQVLGSGHIAVMDANVGHAQGVGVTRQGGPVCSQPATPPIHAHKPEAMKKLPVSFRALPCTASSPASAKSRTPPCQCCMC